MPLVKKDLPQTGSVIIEVYKYEDPNRGVGYAGTLGYVEVDVNVMKQNPTFEDMVNVPKTYLAKYDRGMGVGYQLVTKEELDEHLKTINQELKRLEELKLNLLNVSVKISL